MYKGQVIEFRTSYIFLIIIIFYYTNKSHRRKSESIMSYVNKIYHDERVRVDLDKDQSACISLLIFA